MVKRTYRVPIRYLNGNAAQMLFWDAVYYLLELNGMIDRDGNCYVETSNRQLTELTGLSSQAIAKLRNRAAKQDDERYNLREEEGIQPRSYRFVLRDYESLLSQKVVEKPMSYVEKGWPTTLDYPSKMHSRFPLAVINCFFRKPNGASIKPEELVKSCKHPNRKKLPDRREIDKALFLLKELRILEVTETGAYRLLKNRFDIEANLAWEQLNRQNQAEPEIIRQARKQNPKRAELAERLLRTGWFELTHFAEIFRDLEYVHSKREFALLEETADRHRNKAPSANRWRACWKSFQQKLKRKEQKNHTNKININFSQSPRQEIELPSLQIDNDGLLWAKLVLWVNCPDFLFRHLARQPRLPTIQVTLLRDGSILWHQQLTPEDEVKRCDLTKSIKQAPNQSYLLILEADERLKRVSIKARLEAGCL